MPFFLYAVLLFTNAWSIVSAQVLSTAVFLFTERKSHFGYFSCMWKNCCKYHSSQMYSNENESNTGSDKRLNITRCSGTYCSAVCIERPCSCRSLMSLWHKTNGCVCCFTMEMLLTTALYEFPDFGCYCEVSSCFMGKLLPECSRTVKISITEEILLEAVKFLSFLGLYMGHSS